MVVDNDLRFLALTSFNVKPDIFADLNRVSETNCIGRFSCSPCTGNEPTGSGRGTQTDMPL